MTGDHRIGRRAGNAPLQDGAAFIALYREQAEAVVAFFARRTFDAETAADLTAETFAEAFASRARFREQGHGAASWLFGIAQHKLLRYYRSGRAETRARARLGMSLAVDLGARDSERIDELIDLDARGAELARALARLSRAEQDALRARVVHGQPYREVAVALGCSEQAARARVARGLRHLAAFLTADPGAPA